MSPQVLEARTASAPDTRDLAAAVAALSAPGDVLLLAGGLGAGKTTFAQGFARGLGVRGPVTSPTFTLVRQYPLSDPGPRGRGIDQLLHADVYRLESLAEVADLALAELVEDAAVAVVEWGDVAAPVLPAATLRVELIAEPGARSEGEGARRVCFSSAAGAWEDRWSELGAVVGRHRERSG